MCCSTASTKGFLGGSMKAYQTPSNMLLCVHVFMFSHSASLLPILSHIHTHMRTHLYISLCFSHFIFPRLEKSSKSADIYTHAQTHTHAGRHADEGDTPSVKLQSQICALYCDSGISLLIVAGRNPPSPLL